MVQFEVGVLLLARLVLLRNAMVQQEELAFGGASRKGNVLAHGQAENGDCGNKGTLPAAARSVF